MALLVVINPPGPSEQYHVWPVLRRNSKFFSNSLKMRVSAKVSLLNTTFPPHVSMNLVSSLGCDEGRVTQRGTYTNKNVIRK